MPVFDLSTISTRPPHVADLMEAYSADEGGTTATVPVSVDMTPYKTELADFINNRLQYDLDDWAENPTIVTILTKLRDDLLEHIDQTMPDTATDTVAVSTDIQAALQQVYTDFTNAILTSLPVTDGRCRGMGRYPLGEDTGNADDTKLVHCKTCDGFGAVATIADARPVMIWPEKQLL